MTAWYQHAIIYQIYPRSFADSNGDGIGDLPGITSKLDYLQNLGVDAIWLSPIFDSPMADFGYDIADYTKIDPDYGTLEDCEAMIRACHARGIKVVMDLVPSHTSDQHAWFIESKSSKDNPKRNWYTWQDPKPDGSVPNNWESVFGGPAWTLDEASGQYYLHSFLKEQPDLNWANTEVQRAVQDIMRFWYDRGVDGFRVDAILFTAKDLEFRDNPKSWGAKMMVVDADDEFLEEEIKTANSYGVGKHLTEYIKVMTDVTSEYDNCFLFLEAYPDQFDSEGFAKLYDHCDSQKAAFFFFGLFSGSEGWKAGTFKSWIDGFETTRAKDDVAAYVLGNHDVSRIATRIGSKAAPAAAVALVMLPGSKFIYYGDELGMRDVAIPPEQVHDPSPMARDPERTPMQWTSGAQAGFSTHVPWLPQERNYKRRNVERQSAESNSMLALYRRLIQLHRDIPALHHGSYEPLETGHTQVFGFKRVGEGTVIVLINFSSKKVHLTADITTEFARGELVVSSFMDQTSTPINTNRAALRPYEAVVIRL